jgi:hypothetical protein
VAVPIATSLAKKTSRKKRMLAARQTDEKNNRLSLTAIIGSR